MHRPTFFQRLRPHLIAVLGLLMLAFMYLSPVLQSKTLSMGDVQQSAASAREIREITKETGEKPLWTDAVFSGMPGYMIDFNYPYIFVYRAGMAVFNVVPNTVGVLFAIMLGAYILLVVLGCNAWLSALGAAGYAFGTYDIVSLEAGHISKLYAMGFGAGMLAGAVLVMRGRYWVGAAVTGLFMCLEFGANHIRLPITCF